MTVGPGDRRFGRDGSGADAAVPEPRAAPAGDGPPGDDVRAPAPPPVVPRQRRPAVPSDRHELPPRPRVVPDPAILGLSRITRGRVGSRLFTLFFVLVFTVIVVQMVAAILDHPW
ncbi:hypothetical protein [Pseudonocardia sp. MH-G8]|uniref:hypothetical protein n=1 Tax=Pseudonocardia sp. MH-G8 TaxID=1854588 RepID=UPI000BA0C681|nr:hypothetical protein [Pseudonocardia sp. MH-G8]